MRTKGASGYASSRSGASSASRGLEEGPLDLSSLRYIELLRMRARFALALEQRSLERRYRQG